MPFEAITFVQFCYSLFQKLISGASWHFLTEQNCGLKKKLIKRLGNTALERFFLSSVCTIIRHKAYNVI